MRHIGDLTDETLARRLGDYLLANGITTAVEPEQDRWAVWVIDEDHVEQARAEFARFQADPNDDRYAKAKQAADDRRREAQRQEKQYRKNTVDVRRQWQQPLLAQTPVTAVLIAVSLLVAALTSRFDDFWKLGNKIEPVAIRLFIATSINGLQEVREGQIYRLVTPIFLHFSILHIFFNMLWLRMLGGIVELRRGSWRMLGMVLVIAVTSNVSQYLWSGPAFGGMSGVVFGLFGYVWMKSRYEPQAGFFMPPQTVFWMMAWFVFCLIGPLSIANAAHTVGLIAGVVLGLSGTLLKRLSR